MSVLSRTALRLSYRHPLIFDPRLTRSVPALGVVRAVKRRLTFPCMAILSYNQSVLLPHVHVRSLPSRSQMPRVFCIANQKGGVGKTTQLSISLGQWLALARKPSLSI